MPALCWLRCQGFRCPMQGMFFPPDIFFGYHRVWYFFLRECPKGNSIENSDWRGIVRCMPVCRIRPLLICGPGIREASGLAALGPMLPAAMLHSTEPSEYSDTTPQDYGGLE